jgi:hypothetical protein
MFPKNAQPETGWRRLGQWLRVAPQPAVPDNRSETRIPAHGRVALRWTDDGGESRLVVASLIDLSDRGRRIRCGERPDVDSEVELEEERGRRRRAKVRWVLQEGEDVEVGLVV